MHICAGEGHTEILSYLIKSFNCDVNCSDRYGNTPLADAVKHNRTECIHLLKKYGAKINTNQGYFVSSSIHNAAFLGNTEEIRWLLSQNEDLVNLPDYDFRTPLHLAASEGRAQVLKLLLKNGGKVDVVDRWGHTPYHDAKDIVAMSAQHY